MATEADSNLSACGVRGIQLGTLWNKRSQEEVRGWRGIDEECWQNESGGNGRKGARRLFRFRTPIAAATGKQRNGEQKGMHIKCREGFWVKEILASKNTSPVRYHQGFSQHLQAAWSALLSAGLSWGGGGWNEENFDEEYWYKGINHELGKFMKQKAQNQLCWLTTHKGW